MPTPVKRLIVYFLAFFVLGLAGWVKASFDSPSIEQILYHLTFNHGLVADSGDAFLVTFIVECLVFPALWSVLMAVFERLATRFASGFSNRMRMETVRPIFDRLPSLFLILALSLLSFQVSAFSYLRSKIGRDYFSENYIDPASVQLKTNGLKNLILIYVESLEETYSDERLFGKDLTASIKAAGGFSFKSYLPAPGTGWTIAGIVSTQCGAPLRMITLPIRPQDADKLYMRNAVCLGDVLDGFGYHNVFMGGAQLSFGGKGRFLKDHHYGEVYGKKEWLDAGTKLENMNEWGLQDDELFERAKTKLKTLHDTGKRFNLTLLTLSTHHPIGYPSGKCRRSMSTNFLATVECTSDQVANFVEFVRANGFLKDTNIVILGDHLAMPNSVYQKLQDAPVRSIFNRFISIDSPERTTEQLLPFDMYPSILEFIGVEVVGGRLGLGYSGFSHPGSARSKDDLEDLVSNVLNPSDAYVKLWVTSNQ